MGNYVEVKNIKIGKDLPKICVPLIIEEDSEVFGILQQLQNKNFDLVEIRIDYYKNVENIESVKNLLKVLIENLKNIPIIFTFRTFKEGGQKNIDIEYYKNLNIEAIKTGYIDLIDIEFLLNKDIINNIILEARKNNVKIIISNHNFNETPKKEDIIKILCEMQQLNVDLLKIAVMPKNKQDVLELICATNEMILNYAKVPLITISMGQIGSISRVIGGMFGSAITFAVASKFSAPGQIEVTKLSKLINELYFL